MEKVSANKIKKITKSFDDEKPIIIEYTIGDETISVYIKPHISFKERCALIHDVADFVFDEDGDYIPGFYDFALLFGFVSYYTNIKTDVTVESLYEFGYKTNILDKISSSIKDSFQEIKSAIDSEIEWRKRKQLEQQKMEPVIKKIMSVFDSQIEKFKDVDVSEVIDLARTISKKDEKEFAKVVLDKQINSKIQ